MTYRPAWPTWSQASGTDLLAEYDRLGREIRPRTQVPETETLENDGLLLERRMVRGILIARLDGHTAPVSPGDLLVCITSTATIRCSYKACIAKDARVRVRDITWDSDAGWLLVFEGRSDFELFPAKDFAKVGEGRQEELPV